MRMYYSDSTCMYNSDSTCMPYSDTVHAPTGSVLHKSRPVIAYAFTMASVNSYAVPLAGACATAIVHACSIITHVLKIQHMHVLQ